MSDNMMDPLGTSPDLLGIGPDLLGNGPCKSAEEAFKIEHVDGDTFIQLFDAGLIQTLQKYVKGEKLYELNPKVPANQLFLALPELKKAVGKDSGQKKETRKDQKPSGTICEEVYYDDDYDYGYYPHQLPQSQGQKKLLESLVDSIEVEYESRICKIKKMTDSNVISYNDLFYLFPKDQHVHAVWNERTIGAKVIKATYRSTLFREYMIINAEIIDSDGTTFIHGVKSFTIDSWEGVCNIEELPVVPLPENSPIRDELVARGRKFAKHAIGSHYLQYTGSMFYDTWFGTISFKGDGRVMADAVSFAKMNPSYNMKTAKKTNKQINYEFRMMEPQASQEFDHNEKSVREEELFMCAPTLYGFSFSAKKWGQIYVDLLDDISFNDEAFDQLVMDPIKKDLISCLVTSKHKGEDLISGKGGGCIFLLHGPPGVGKTLTAEAISEYLHRPLYSVSVGELGTTIVDLEHKLSEILEVASVWNAVILIDEADIFLERRSDNDIQRNALVSIFLRLLEYHQGVLFLTTNRVKCFDTAFQSRISVSLKYNDLDADAREQIWRTFLDRVEGKGKSQVNIEDLKKRPLNGREIKTTVRLAKALATKNNPEALITTQHLETVLSISKSFSEDLEKKTENNLEN